MIFDSVTIRIILAALACYRLAEFISVDIGPYRIFDRFRLWTGKRAAGKPVLSFWRQLAELVGCPFCTGIYASILMCILILVPSVPGDIFILLLGLAGAQTFLEQFGIRRD